MFQIITLTILPIFNHTVFKIGRDKPIPYVQNDPPFLYCSISMKNHKYSISLPLQIMTNFKLNEIVWAEEFLAEPIWDIIWCQLSVIALLLIYFPFMIVFEWFEKIMIIVKVSWWWVITQESRILYQFLIW